MHAIRSARLKNGDGWATFKQSFAAGLSRALKERGLSQQKKAAKALGISEPTLSSWLSGEKTPRDDETWERIKAVTGRSYAELLLDPDDPEDPYTKFLKRELEARGLKVVKTDRKH
jgi:transcriptional regulator with XRE-family HTH domain